MTAVAVGAYSSYSANQRADAQANAQNAANAEAYNRSVERAAQDSEDRKAELLRRFGISSSKLKNTSQDIARGTATQLTALDMELAKAQSVTDNKLATQHITGRLADRFRNTIDIQGGMQKGNILQNTEAQLKETGNKLETMTMNYESDQLDLDIDYSNSINAANNQLVANHAYSQSTGLVGIIATGASTALAAKGANLTYGGN
jgi:hypothetical protein